MLSLKTTSGDLGTTSQFGTAALRNDFPEMNVEELPEVMATSGSHSGLPTMPTI